jgi:hypothetical protein
MVHSLNFDKSSLKEMAKKGLNEEQIYEQLIEQQFSPTEAREMIETCKKENCMRQQKNGLTLLVIGAFTCFVSCLFTMLELMPSLTNFFLYGMTSAGVMVVFGGLIMVFEKSNSLA